MKKIFIVVPTIREISINRFLKEWQILFQKYSVCLIIIEDNPQKTFSINVRDFKFKIFHYCWKDIEKDLKKDEWVIPRRSSAIKSYGFFKAFKFKAEIIIALDDDCYPLDTYISDFSNSDLIRAHYYNLFVKKISETKWVSTIKNIRPRGLPYKNTDKVYNSDDIVLSHGLWANIPDLDGKTQLQTSQKLQIEDYFVEMNIPIGAYFSMCGMNIAFKREVTPAMYFMLMGKDKKEKPYGYDRFDDIWAGIFIKKISDHLNKRIVSGYPVVWHDRASDPKINFEKEKSGMIINERLWEEVDNVQLTQDNFKDCYKELAQKLKSKNPYVMKLKKAMIVWSELF